MIPFNLIDYSKSVGLWSNSLVTVIGVGKFVVDQVYPQYSHAVSNVYRKVSSLNNIMLLINVSMLLLTSFTGYDDITKIPLQHSSDDQSYLRQYKHLCTIETIHNSANNFLLVYNFIGGVPLAQLSDRDLPPIPLVNGNFGLLLEDVYRDLRLASYATGYARFAYDVFQNRNTIVRIGRHVAKVIGIDELSYIHEPVPKQVFVNGITYDNLIKIPSSNPAYRLKLDKYVLDDIRNNYRLASTVEKKFFHYILSLLPMDIASNRIKSLSLIGEILCGAQVHIPGTDMYTELRNFEKIGNIHNRDPTSSHASNSPQFSYRGAFLFEILFGTRVREKNNREYSWFQVERHSISDASIVESILHVQDYIIYRLTNQNVGPYGTSKFLEKSPLYIDEYFDREAMIASYQNTQYWIQTVLDTDTYDFYMEDQSRILPLDMLTARLDTVKEGYSQSYHAASYDVKTYQVEPYIITYGDGALPKKDIPSRIHEVDNQNSVDSEKTSGTKKPI